MYILSHLLTSSHIFSHLLTLSFMSIQISKEQAVESLKIIISSVNKALSKGVYDIDEATMLGVSIKNIDMILGHVFNEVPPPQMVEI